MSESGGVLRVFVDSNVLIEGLFAPWSASRAILILARAGVLRLVLSPCSSVSLAIRRRGSRLIDDYALALKLVAPERTKRITREEFESHRALIRHINDVPVLVTAIKAQPDWLVTANTEHFNADVAARTGLQIATPREFLARRRIGA